MLFELTFFIDSPNTYIYTYTFYELFSYFELDYILLLRDSVRSDIIVCVCVRCYGYRRCEQIIGSSRVFGEVK